MDERMPPFIVVDEAPALVEILLLFKASACARFDGIRPLFRIVVVVEEKNIQEDAYVPDAIEDRNRILFFVAEQLNRKLLAFANTLPIRIPRVGNRLGL